MRYFSISAFLICFLITAADLQAQANDKSRAGSFYSSFGFGAPTDTKSPYAEGMGLTGVASFTNMSPNIANPAMWGLIGFTQGNVSASFTNFNASDNFSSANNSLFAFDNFQVVMPLLRNRLGVSVAFTPMTRSNYQVFGDGVFDPIDGLGIGQVEFTSSTLGSGGINRFETGAGVRLFSNFTVGYALSAHLLSQEQQVTTLFSDDSYRNIITDKKITGYGLGHRFGAFFNKGGIFRSDDQISIGAAINLPVNIDADRSISTFRQVGSGNRRTLVELNEGDPTRDGEVRLPLEFNAGLTYNLSRFVNISTELQIQEWGNARYSYSSAQEAFYKDRMRAGFGVQYHPYRAEQARGFFNNIKYSLGASFDNGHLSINGEDIETIFINAGFGLIPTRSSSSVDLNVHYGIRGTQSSDLVKENIWGFTLSLNLAEFMFVRQRFQ
jgi:hypothetical protein